MLYATAGQSRRNWIYLNKNRGKSSHTCFILFVLKRVDKYAILTIRCLLSIFSFLYAAGSKAFRSKPFSLIFHVERNKTFFPLKKIKEGEVDTILLCLKEKTKIKWKKEGEEKKNGGKTKEKWCEGVILFKTSQIWCMRLAHSTLCFSSKKQMLILVTIFVRGRLATLWKKCRNFERLTCCRGKQKERSFIDSEKIFVWKLDQNKQFEKENVFKPISRRLEGFENMNQNRISRRSYTGLWKVIIVCTWPLCESDSFELLKK